MDVKQPEDQVVKIMKSDNKTAKKNGKYVVCPLFANMAPTDQAKAFLKLQNG
jgi:HrpA-like RNA helicase